jgi:hypothetical protein
LQEHKLRGNKLQELGPHLWRRAVYHAYAALPAYNHGPHDDGTGSGGIAMLIFSKLNHLIHSQGNINDNQTQWVILQGCPGGDLGVLNVYALHMPQDCILLWQIIEVTLPTGIQWVLASNWNMVLDRNDNSHPNSKRAGDTERLVFMRMIGHLGVEDLFPATGSISFPWDNKRRVGVRKLKLLDRFYFFRSPSGYPAAHVSQYEILGNCLASDHLLVCLDLELYLESPQGSGYKVNKHYLEDHSVVEQLHEVWRLLPTSLAFFGKLKRLVKWYKIFCRNKATERKARDVQLQQRLQAAHQLL